jgi:hypothetical protein
MADGFVTVPPGHKVVVVHPATFPGVARTESGCVIAQLAADVSSDVAFDSVEQLAASGQQAAVIWILQDALLSRLDDQNELIARLRSVVNWPGSQVQHVAVLVCEAANRRGLADELKALGIGVHSSAADGACFVEVHRPDGSIFVGMPGLSI